MPTDSKTSSERLSRFRTNECTPTRDRPAHKICFNVPEPIKFLALAFLSFAIVVLGIACVLHFALPLFLNR